MSEVEASVDTLFEAPAEATETTAVKAETPEQQVAAKKEISIAKQAVLIARENKRIEADKAAIASQAESYKQLQARIAVYEAKEARVKADPYEGLREFRNGLRRPG